MREGLINIYRAMRSIYGSLRGTILSSRRGCSGNDNFQYFSRTVMQRSKSSEPHLLTSKLLLSKSVVKVIIICKLFIRHSLFARHAQPSLLPVKEAVPVLAA